MQINSLEDLGVLINNETEYKGKLPNYQRDTPKEGQRKHRIQEKELTPYQNLLYRRALFGLEVYTSKEIKAMHWQKRNRITAVNKKAQKSINIFKQERVNILSDKISLLFPKSSLAQDIFSSKKIATDPEFINNLELKSLGITKTHIVNRLIVSKVLPKNFYELKEVA